MVVQYRGHPITKKLTRLRELRTLHVQAIKFELKKAIKLDETGEDELVLNLNNAITRFLDKLHESKNEVVMHQRLLQFIDQVATDSKLAQALSKYDMITLISELEATLEDTVSYLNERTASIAKRPKLETELIKKEVIEVIKYLFNEIELAQLRNPSIDYSELIDEMNGMLRNMNTLINRRQAYNQRKAEEGENGDKDGDNPSDNPDNPEEDDDNTPLPDVYTLSINSYDHEDDNENLTLETDLSMK